MANGLQRFSEAPAGEPGAIQQDKGQPGGAAQGADTGTGQDKPARQGEGRGKPPAFAQVLAQDKATQARYPGFQLAKELGNPAFGSLLAAGAPVRAAYELAHRRELILAAMGYAVRPARPGQGPARAPGRRGPAAPCGRRRRRVTSPDGEAGKFHSAPSLSCTSESLG